VNPASRGGRTARLWPGVEPRVRERLGPGPGEIEVEATRAPRDAVRIAREAVRAGVERLIVAGGDGTLAEVVTGLAEAGRIDAAEIGMLPLGSGCDFARCLGVPSAVDQAIEQIAAGGVRRVDVGRVELCDRDGKPRVSHFLNEASVGLSGDTVERVSRASKRAGPGLGFMLGAVGAILGHRPVEARVHVDDVEVHAGPLSMLVAANGCYFGAGMRVAPDARADDGVFDVVVVAGLSRTRLLWNLSSFRSGGHVSHPAVTIHRGSRVRVETETPMPVDVDGEAAGSTPMAMQLAAASLLVVGAAPDAPGLSPGADERT